MNSKFESTLKQGFSYFNSFQISVFDQNANVGFGYFDNFKNLSFNHAFLLTNNMKKCFFVFLVCIQASFQLF